MKLIRHIWLALLLSSATQADILHELRPTIHEAAKENGINPVMLEAIMRHESANGKSALARKRNNLAGIKGKRGYRRFKNKEECIYYTADLLKRYARSGRKTLAQINKRYAPRNPEWKRKVATHMKRVDKEIRTTPVLAKEEPSRWERFKRILGFRQ